MKTRTLRDWRETNITVGEIVKEFKRSQEPIGLHIPGPGVVMVLMPWEDYDYVIPILEAREVLSTRKRRTPFDLFADTVRRLRELEHKYGTSSAKFYEGFQNGDIQEGPLDYFDWRVEYGSFLSMKERFGFSEDEVNGD